MLYHLLSEMACSYVWLIPDGKRPSPQKKSQLVIPKYKNQSEKAHTLHIADLSTMQAMKEPELSTVPFCA